MKSYDTIEEAITIQLIEKKSRFIGSIFPVSTEDEVSNILISLKSKYKDAGHNCYGYIVGIKEGFSDDGEPQGTAGKPILATIRGSGLNNILVVVTRYFGGTLLGTGGLVRAYSQSTKLAIESASRISLVYGYKIMIQIDYCDLSKLQYLLEQRRIKELESIFTDKVQIIIEIPEDEVLKLEDLVTNMTNGKGNIKKMESTWIISQ
jgi:uncharacterized YigZ family protein